MISESAIAKSVQVTQGVIRKEYGPYAPDVAGMLVGTTLDYRRQLKEAGVLLPVNIQTASVITPDGTRIVIEDEFVTGASKAGDCSMVLKTTEDTNEAYKITQGMFDFLNRLPDGDDRKTTSVMGDFKPANWVSADRGLVFIDHFLPRVWDWRNRLVTPYIPAEDAGFFTPENMTYLWGVREGQVGRLLGLLKRQHPAVFSYACNYAQETSPSHVADFICREAPEFPSINKAYAR